METRITEIFGILNTDRFRLSVDEQVRVIKLFRDSVPILSTNEIESAEATILSAINRANRTTHSIERFRKICELTHEPDMRLAVSCDPPTTPDRRTVEEHLYPTTGWLGRYMLYAQANEAPPAFHFWSGVATLGSACRRWLYLEFGIKRLYPHHYVILLGKSGSRKSTSLSIASSMLARLHTAVDAVYAEYAERFRIVRLPQRVTPEALVELLSVPEDSVFCADSIGYIVADELSTLFGKKQYGSDGLVVALTTLYDGKADFSSGTIIRGQKKLVDPTLTAMFGSTIDWVRDNMSESMLTGGFLPRCTMVYRANENGRIFPFPRGLDPITECDLANELVALTSGQFSNPDVLSRTPAGSIVRPTETTTSVFLDEDASIEYTKWYTEYKAIVADQPESKASGYIARKPEHVLKLSMLLAISDALDSGPRLTTPCLYINARHFIRALSIIDYEERSLPGIWREIGMTELTSIRDEILGAINQHPDTGIAMRDLSKQFHARFATKNQFQAQLQFLEESGLIEEFRPKGTTQRFARYRITADGKATYVRNMRGIVSELPPY